MLSDAAARLHCPVNRIDDPADVMGI